MSLARALVRNPDLLLLDEPFSALDALTRIPSHRLVLDLWDRHRPGVLLVTHDVDEALLLADRVLVLDGGRIAQCVSVRMLRPSVHPSFWSSSRNAATQNLSLPVALGMCPSARRSAASGQVAARARRAATQEPHRRPG